MPAVPAKQRPVKIRSRIPAKSTYCFFSIIQIRTAGGDLNGSVRMQAFGNVVIGQHRQSVHEAMPHICRAKAIPTSLLIFQK